MSFYDLTKNSVLSAKELFKYRVKRDATIPSRGGQKDFEPDGSWIQSKALEAYMQERTSVLAEPRVEKVKSLVEGVWQADERLINLKKPGKFWAHMGFTDQSRNWLYPEEALFLIETNTLEVYHNEVPLSIEEAYEKFLGSGVSIEEYQVFSHLRRLGYVVLRHDEQPLITPYEKQINLDKYISKQNRKERKGKFLKQGKKLKQSCDDTKSKGDNDSKDSQSHDSTNIKDLYEASREDSKQCQSKDILDKGALTSDINSPGAVKESTASKNKEENPSDSTGNITVPLGSDNVACVNNEKTSLESIASNVIVGDATTTSTGAKRNRSEDSFSDFKDGKKVCLETDITAEEDSAEVNNSTKNVISVSEGGDISRRGFYDNVWNTCFSAKPLHSPKTSEVIDITDVDPDSTVDSSQKKSLSQKHTDLPSIAGKTIVGLSKPNTKLLPPNVEISEDLDDVLLFDVEDYRLKNPPPPETRQAQREEEQDNRVRALNFSFAEWTQRKPDIKATNWAEYKKKMKKRMLEISTSTPVDHLWKGEITPLVRPEDALSYKTILDKLSIIQSASNESLTVDSDCVLDVKISYDVHLPDHRFKKSMPGTPNHRVCVTKCSSDPPGLAEIQQVWSRFRDGVPLHWAVVDSGEIAFYVFDNTHSLELLP